MQGNPGTLQKTFKADIASLIIENYSMQNGGESLDAQGQMMWHCTEKEAPTTCLQIIQSRCRQVALYRMS